MSQAKKNSAKKVMSFVKDNTTIALGSGSTAIEFIKLLAIEVKKGLNIKCVATSFDSSITAVDLGVNVISFDRVDNIDLAIDGADVVSDIAILKGGGGACTIEKLIDYYADKFIVIADEGKLRDTLSGKVVVEVLPIAYKSVMKRFNNAVLRKAEKKLGPVITDNGNFLIDIEFNEIKQPKELEKEINNIPGVVENGIFTKFDEVIIGTENSAYIKNVSKG
jgi:ribose 5-phosphate isomerase A